MEAKIKLAHLTHNLNQIKKVVGGRVNIMAVVKANAYGHGLVPLAKHLHLLGISNLGVARLEEALELKRTLPSSTILILSPVHNNQIDLAISKKISLALSELSQLTLISKIAKRRRIKARVHIKVDTDMHRSGTDPVTVVRLAGEADKLKSVNFEGIFTHLADADNPERSFTLKQINTFTKVIDRLKQENITPKFVHCANSAAAIKYPESRFNMVRVGLALYGINPFYPNQCPVNLKPVLSLFAPISRVHKLKPGDLVGYNLTFKAKKPMTIATVSAGYADGIRRAPNPWPGVLISDQFCPTIGRISMDQMVVDITKVKPKPKIGDTVTLVSNKADNPCSADEIGKIIGTNSYEVLASLSPNRIHRSHK